MWIEQCYSRKTRTRPEEWRPLSLSCSWGMCCNISKYSFQVKEKTSFLITSVAIVALILISLSIFLMSNIIIIVGLCAACFPLYQYFNVWYQNCCYFFLWPQSACVDNPCDNNSTCQSGFTDKGYRCLCTTGFKGPRCKKGNSCHVKPAVSSCSLQFYTQLLKAPVKVKVRFFFYKLTQ